MRFIEKDFNNAKARARLTRAANNTEVSICVANQSGVYTSSRYGHIEIREELKDIYFDKCCYCEVSIRPVDTPNIEHYRPVGAIEGVNENGYYWLGYEWSNLLLACPACNKKKGTKFPVLRNNNVVNHPTTVLGNIDFTQFPISSGYFNEERPLIINPELVDPYKLFYIDYFCNLIPIKDNIRAKETIKEIKLNRDDLVAARQSIVDEIILRIEQQIERRFGPNRLNNLQFQDQLNLIFQDIVGRINPEAEFTLLGKCMIERFEELILEDIDRTFRREIRAYFVIFLRNL